MYFIYKNAQCNYIICMTMFGCSSIILVLQTQARFQGLWNLFMPLESDPDCRYGAGLTNLEYAHLAEMMGHSIFASEVS